MPPTSSARSRFGQLDNYFDVSRSRLWQQQFPIKADAPELDGSSAVVPGSSEKKVLRIALSRSPKAPALMGCSKCSVTQSTCLRAPTRESGSLGLTLWPYFDTTSFNAQFHPWKGHVSSPTWSSLPVIS